MISVDAHLRLVAAVRQKMPADPAVVRAAIETIDQVTERDHDAHVRAWAELERRMAAWQPGDDWPWPGHNGLDLSRLSRALSLLLPPDGESIAEADRMAASTEWIGDLALPDRPPLDAPLWRLLVYPVQRWWRRRKAKLSTPIAPTSCACGYKHPWYPGSCEDEQIAVRQRYKIAKLRARKEGWASVEDYLAHHQIDLRTPTRLPRHYEDSPVSSDMACCRRDGR